MSWYDYGFLEKSERNLAFILEWGAAFILFRQSIGENGYEVNVLKDFSIENPEGWNDWAQADKLCAIVDSFKISYVRFWDQAMALACDRGFKMPLLHCFLNGDFLTQIIEKCLENKILEYSSSPYFWPEIILGEYSPVQKEYFRHLVSYFLDKGREDFEIGELLGNYLPEEWNIFLN